MGKLHKSMKKYSPAGRLFGKKGKKFYDSLHFMGEQSEAQYDATKAAEKAAATPPPEEKPIPLPDEEQIARMRRRRTRRRGSRESTNLSDDRFGV